MITETKTGGISTGKVITAISIPVALGLAVVLLGNAILAAPYVTAVFVVLIIALAIAFVRMTERNAAHDKDNMRDVVIALARAGYGNGPPAGGMVIDPVREWPALPGPAADRVIETRRNYDQGAPAGVALSRTAIRSNHYKTRDPIQVSGAALVAATEILLAGGQPTRAEFEKRGIKSHTAIAAAIEFLEGMEYVDRGAGAGDAAEWAPNVTAADAAGIRAHFEALAARVGGR